MSDKVEAGLTREEIEHVALLARLNLTDDEIDDFGRQLNRILGAFETLNELQTDDVPPTSHPAPILNVTRKDETRPSLHVEEALANAPDAEAACFKTAPAIPEGDKDGES